MRPLGKSHAHEYVEYFKISRRMQHPPLDAESAQGAAANEALPAVVGENFERKHTQLARSPVINM